MEALGVAEGTSVGLLLEGGRFKVTGVLEEVAERLVEVFELLLEGAVGPESQGNSCFQVVNFAQSLL